MFPMQKTSTASVSNRGAAAGSVLSGFARNNQGIRLQILEEQPRGRDGAIKGNFVILDVGDNMHSQSLQSLLHKVTDAQEVLKIIRQNHPACLSVINSNILVLEA